MSYHLQPFAQTGLDETLLEYLIKEHESQRVPAFERYWSYYRNSLQLIETRTQAGRREWAWRPAQYDGLPTRLKSSETGTPAKEVVIENDIAWRLHALVDYMAGREVQLASTAADASVRQQINRILEAALTAFGGVRLLQQAALLGAVYGHVDFILRTDALLETAADSTGSFGKSGSSGGDLSSMGSAIAAAPSNHVTDQGLPHDAAVMRALDQMTLETVEAPRAIPLLNPHDYRTLDAYLISYHRPRNEIQKESAGRFMARLGRWALGAPVGKTSADRGPQVGSLAGKRATTHVMEILSADHRQVYEDGQLVYDGVNRIGALPVVHVQDGTQPYYFDGLGEVEPLIPLQDELNTRLSDRANRVTLQSFKMYLGKGIDGFGERPIGPGQMWMTDNLDSSIEEFGGDAASPSEEAHIREVREALDKASSVTPLAAGVIQGNLRVGSLSSENALRISLLGILSKIERKRQRYSEGLASVFGLLLEALDQAGIMRTQPADRGIDVLWTAAVPEDQSKKLEEAVLKRDLGVPRQRILSELGYGPDELGDA
ncbi:MAG: phage portal protein [Planctomycetes bacterium]|nr:phage portal protein [Planctomycetota bacterium]NOG55900.1 phage portal protein [Planctomycetota bacterium]